MQKFTRALTREVEVGGQRLAFTFDAEGLAVRPVGSRRPPSRATWASVVSFLASSAAPAAPKPAAQEAPAADAIPALLARLQKWLDQHRPRYAQGLAPGASAQELAALEQGLGQPAPAGLRELLSWHNGQSADFVGAFEGTWELMSAARIVAAHQDLSAQAGAGQTAWQRGLVPFLDNDAGDYRCLDTGQPGAPVVEVRLGSPSAQPLVPSLEAWLEDFVAAVERGEYHEDSERGHFLRRR